MKISENIDITTIVTVLGFIVAMVAWGIRLEGQVGKITSNIEGKEEMYNRMNDIKQQGLERRLGHLEQEIVVIKKRLREYTNRELHHHDEQKDQD